MPETSAPLPAGDTTQWLPPSPEELQKLLPQYEISALIGRGGMGAVYRGRQSNLDRAVAIKILPPGLDDTDATFSERFRNEALAMAKLNHPGLVAVYDFGKTKNGMLYIVMEFVDGTDVAHMMAKKGRLSSEHAMAITAHVCDALKYAHERGIVHRDIKPANIMVGYDGVVKVADFGLAKMSQSGQSTGLTQSGLAMGTMHYIAPEALTLGASVDQRADIYAMGVMLYHMLTGGLPHGMFELPSMQVPGLDPRYDAIISRALRNDRERRYQNVGELRHDLDAILTRPVVVVEANASQAPAALNTMARPQRPAETPKREPQKQAPPPPPRQKIDISFWVPVLGVVGALVAAFVWLAHPERKTIQRIEGETMTVIRVTGGKAEPRADVGNFKMAVWSGGSHLWWMHGQKDDVLTLKLPVSERGRQRVKALFTVAADCGIVDVRLDGHPVPGSPFDLQAEDITLAGVCDLGVHDLTAGEHELTLKVQGTHGKNLWCGDSCAGIDYIQLEPPVVTAAPAAPGTDVALKATPSASSCPKQDYVTAMNCGLVYPDNLSNYPYAERMRQSWWPRLGGLEWAQYEWDTPQVINECQVLWYADVLAGSGHRGGSALPAFWRILYRDETGAWVPVDSPAGPAAPERDQWNSVKFAAVKTTALRLSLQCQPGQAAGIYTWKAIAADPATVAAPTQRAHPALFLGDLSPLHYQVGWDVFSVSQLAERYTQEGCYVAAAGRPCSQYLWAHASSRLEFAIPEGYTHFKATGIRLRNDRPGRSDDGSGTWTYAVEVDGKPIFTSQRLHDYPNSELPIDLAFPAGSRRLTLIIDNGGDGNNDHSLWAYPTLSTDGVSAPLPAAANAAPAPAPAAPPSKPAPQQSMVVKAATGSTLPMGYSRGRTVSLFNGRDLTGWSGLNQFWSVQDGAITMKTTADNRPNAFTSLIWKDEVTDFEFVCQFKISGGDSKAWRISGIQFRGQLRDRSKYSVAGYNADLDYDWRFTGGLVEKLGRDFPTKRGDTVILRDSDNPRKPMSEVVDSFGTADDIGRRIKRDDWSTYKIVAAGRRIQLFVNDLPTIDVVDETKEAPKSGLLALSNFYNSVMTVQFKDLQLTELKSDGSDVPSVPALPSQLRLKIWIFTNRTPEALDNVLAPLNEEVDPTLRPSLVTMRDELIAEGRAKPASSLDAYRAAHALCIAMMSALDERAATRSESAWTARSQALRPVLEDLYARTRRLLSTVP